MTEEQGRIGRERVLAGLGVGQRPPTLGRGPAVAHQRDRLAVPAALGVDQLARRVEVRPGVLELVEVLDVPVVPQRVLDDGRGATTVWQPQVEVAIEGRRGTRPAEHRVANEVRQERLGKVEVEDRRVAPGNLEIVATRAGRSAHQPMMAPTSCAPLAEMDDTRTSDTRVPSQEERDQWPR